MTLADIAAKARFDTNTNSTDYSDANLLININVWMQKVVSMILESQDESDFDDANITATYPVYKRTLAARRDYAYSTASWIAIGKEGGSNAAAAAVLPLKVKRMDVTWDGGSTFYKAEPIDNGELPYGLGADAQTDANFIRQAPRYDIRSNAVFLYPAPTSTDVNNGAYMLVEFERNVTPFTGSDLSTGTAVPGFDAPFHPVISDGAAFEYAVARQLPQLEQIQGRLQDWEIRIRQYYSRKQLDRRLSLTPAYDDGYGR